MLAVQPVLAGGLHLTLTTFSALFTTFRVLLWAFLVAVAWYEIIESAKDKDLVQREAKRAKYIAARQQRVHPRQVNLTATALRQLDEQNPPAPRWPAHIPPMAGVSEMGEDESVDQWSIWNEQKQDKVPPQACHVQSMLPPTNGEPIISSAPPALMAPNNHYAAVPGASAAIRPADRDEAQVLAATTMGGNTDLIKEPAKEVVRHGPGGEKHKAKKPFFARKVEKWFVAPYAQKYERVGYMMYKGAMRVERGVNNLAQDLDESIREAGVEAVNRVEVAMRKYVKFFGAVVLLTVVLLPLPSVHLTLSV